VHNASRRQFLQQAGGIAYAATLPLAGVAAAAAQTKGQSSPLVVTLENLGFNPPELTAHVGDRIVWTNKDLVPHTATADAKAFDSGTIAPNASWTYVARKAGVYAYGCTFHPNMKGKLTVL
jgi:plastocyanin